MGNKKLSAKSKDQTEFQKWLEEIEDFEFLTEVINKNPITDDIPEYNIMQDLNKIEKYWVSSFLI